MLLMLTCITASSAVQAETDYCLQNQPPGEIKHERPAVKNKGIDHEFTLTDFLQTGKAVGKFELTNDVKKNSGKRQIARKAAALPELDGKWIMNYEPLLINSAPGGCSVTLRTVAGKDSVYLDNFWRKGTKLKGTIDRTKGCIKVPIQYITSHNLYGKLNVAPVDHDTGTPLTGQSIEFYPQEDGTLTSPTWWALVVASGDEKNTATDAYYMTKMQRGNSTMKHTTGDARDSYPVIAVQTGENIVTIDNFRDLGHKIDIVLKRDKTAVIHSQVAYESAAQAKYMTVGNVKLNDKQAPTSWTDDIEIAYSSDKTLKWSDWTLLFGNAYWVGFMTDTKIELPFDLKYPTPYTSTEFKGSGTASDPYRISTGDDMELLADKVNGTAMNSKDSDGNDIAKAYTGKYFLVTNDIDMKGVRFTPIGNDGLHLFDATFDGGNHKISNLSISPGKSSYSAIFGVVGESATVKNLTIENITVSTTGITPAALASMSYGKIDNCHVINADINTPNRAAAGLVGIGGNISNCTVKNSKIYAGEGFAGGIVAQLNGPISNSSVTGTAITVALVNYQGTPTGGIVGAANAYNIDRCYFQGEIYGRLSQQYTRIGGIAGLLNGGAITNCYATGMFSPVLGENSITGGIVGASYGNVENCYSAINIYNPKSSFSGGIAGMSMYSKDSNTGVISVGTYKNCYTASSTQGKMAENYNNAIERRELFGSFDLNNPPKMENCYYNKQITSFGSKGGLTTAELTTAAGPEGFSKSDWVLAEGYYPRLKGMDNTAVAQMAASALQINNDDDYTKVTHEATAKTLGDTKFGFKVDGKFTTKGIFGSFEGNQLKLNKEEKFGTDSLMIVNGDMCIYHPITLLPIPYEGKGTEASPYLIKTKQDLITLSKMTSESRVSYTGMYFLMTNDIDMEYDEHFLCLSFDLENSQNPPTFMSVFDGGGHQLKRLYIGGLVWKVKPEDDPAGLGTVDTNKSLATWKGFVGRLGTTGVLRNLTISSDAKIELFASGGAFAGWNYGLIENCRNYADVKGQSSWMGGIAGQNLRDARIEKCLNTGTVTSGYRNAGGITAVNTMGYIGDCVNTGEVKVIPGYQKAGKNNLKYAGGIAGGNQGGRIENCLNTANIFALEGNAGGIAGTVPSAASSSPFGSDVRGCLSYGVVTCGVAATTGAIAGDATSANITDNYYDAKIMIAGAVQNTTHQGCHSLSTKQLTDGSALEGFNNDLWQYDKGMYPMLKAFSNDIYAERARKSIVTFADTENVSDIHSDAILASTSGLNWSLSSGKEFKIEGNMLKAPKEVKTFVVDTLTADFSGQRKHIFIRSVPAIPLKGEGSKVNPYLISNAEDWNAFAKYQSDLGVDFQSKHFKITDDIDFKGGEFHQIGASPTAFNGGLDGNGKTVSGYTFETDKTGAGTFGIIGSNSIIRNLTLAGTIKTTTTTSKSHIGGFAGIIHGKILDCVNKTKISTPKGYAGGFAGKAEAGSEFIRCVNKGEIEAFGSFGGFAGETAEGVLFEECVNEGLLHDMGLSSSYANYVGGIVGRALGPNTFIKCQNKGTFKFEKPLTSFYVAGIIGDCTGGKEEGKYFVFEECGNYSDIEAGGDIGGITAYTATAVGAAKMKLTKCYNKGNLHSIGSGSSYYVGGISTKYKPGSTYIECYNEGILTSDKSTYVGGIAAATSGVPTAALPVMVENCYNSGEINALGGDGGGIMGNVNTYVTIKGCYNTGAIKGKYGLGGIAGAVYGATASIQNCWNNGDVTADTNRAGGIAGYNGANGGLNSTISDCWNAGDIVSLCEKGGETKTGTSASGYAIGGIVGLSPATLTNCVNFGTVKGASQVGGVVGTPVKDRTKINSCINVGRIEAPADTCGNILGVNIANGKLWTAKNTESGSIYATDFGTYINDKLGQGMKLSELTAKNMDDSWFAGDAYSVPLPKVFADNNAALLYSAQVILADGDLINGIITKDFKVGVPAGLAWSSSAPEFEINGNDVRFLKKYKGKFTLTARNGDYSKTIELEADGDSGVDIIDADGQIVKTEWFDISGMAVPEPEKLTGKIYIVRITYDNGKVYTVKVTGK